MNNILQNVAHNILDDYEKPSKQLVEDIRQLQLILEEEIAKGNNVNEIVDRIKVINKAISNHDTLWSDLLYFIDQQYHLKQYLRENDILDRIKMRFTHGSKLDIRLIENPTHKVEYVEFIYSDSCIIFQPDIIDSDGRVKMVTTAMIPRNLFFRYYLNFHGQTLMSNVLDVADKSCLDIHEFETPVGMKDIRHINSEILFAISKIKP